MRSRYDGRFSRRKYDNGYGLPRTTYGQRRTLATRMQGLGCMGVVAIFIALVIVGGVTFSIANATHVTHRTCTVDSKDRTTKPKGGSDMRLYTTDCGVLTVSDSLLSWNWHSADTYASIEPHHRYEFTMRGYRIPFFSMFPNVVDATEVK